MKAIAKTRQVYKVLKWTNDPKATEEFCGYDFEVINIEGYGPKLIINPKVVILAEDEAVEASLGDWLLQEKDGSISVYSDEEFHQLFEVIEQ